MNGCRIKILGCILLIVAIFGLARLYYHLTDDFRLGNIRYEELCDVDWGIPLLSAEERNRLVPLFNQKFYYIGKGAQCYAFMSQDQQYVLKFFKFKHLKPTWFVRFLPSIFPFKAYKESVIERKKKKLDGVFAGYRLAYLEDKEDSGLLYIHLSPTQDLKQTVTVVDKIGFERQIALDDAIFLLQRKGETLLTRMHRQLQASQIESAKESISHIIAMYKREYDKGIYDRDHGVMHNTGFVQDHPFHLDSGKLTKNDQMRQLDVYKQDLEHVVWKIDTWVKYAYPTYHPALSSYLAEQYRFYTGESIEISLIDAQKFIKRRH